jgi:hypothetical protein
MAIKLLASVNLVGSSEASVSSSLVPLTSAMIASRAGKISIVPSGDGFAWSSSTQRGGANFIDGTLVEDSQSDGTGRAGGEYVSGWGWSRPVGSTAIDHYLFYTAAFAGWRGRFIDLYA